MARYVYTIPGLTSIVTGPDRLSREYRSIVAARKAGLKAIHDHYAYGETVVIKEVGDARYYDIGEITCTIRGTAFYKSDPMGKPRPNNIRKGTWYLKNDGTLGLKI